MTENIQPNGLTIECVPTGRNAVTMTARLGGEVLALEKLDLGKPKARASFADAVCKDRPGIERKAVESELLRLAADVAAKPDAAANTTAEKTDAAALLEKMPETVRAEARTMLDSPHLMQRIVEDIGALDVAGEKELAATLYLVGTSRLLPSPLAAMVQGPSSSGKSYTVKKTSSLFPPDAILTATQLTPQALFYMQPGGLVHRFVVTGEHCQHCEAETLEKSFQLADRAAKLREQAQPQKPAPRIAPCCVAGGMVESKHVGGNVA